MAVFFFELVELGFEVFEVFLGLEGGKSEGEEERADDQG